MKLNENAYADVALVAVISYFSYSYYVESLQKRASTEACAKLMSQAIAASQPQPTCQL